MRKRLVLIPMLLFTINVVLANPTAFHTEKTIFEYLPNTTLILNWSKGWVNVSVNNPNDTLQYVRVNLTGTDNTNLVSNTTYDSVVSGEETLFHNTSTSELSYYYNITNPAITDNITLGLHWRNIAGGIDLNTTENTLEFNITLNSSINVNTTLYFNTNLDCNGTNDCLNITSLNEGLINDSDSDGFNDAFKTNVSLTKGVELNISFTAKITPDINFDQSLLYVDIGSSDSIRVSLNNTISISGLNLSDLFSRGPIKQGVDMTFSGNDSQARCFIENLGVNTTYVVHSWDLINFTDSVVLASGSPELVINPGQRYNTPYHGVQGSEKLYYSCAFDWEVIWGSNITQSISESRINGPVLYELDTWAGKEVLLVFDNATGRSLHINDTARHLGHSILGVNQTLINSVIPHLSDSSFNTSWNVSDVTVTYKNSTGYYDLTPYASITIINATNFTDGLVSVYFSNISSILGHSLMQNEDLILGFDILAPPSNLSDTYTFTGNATMWTDSGTPDTEVFQAVSVGVTLEMWQFPEVFNSSETVEVIVRVEGNSTPNIIVYQNGTKILEQPMNYMGLNPDQKGYFYFQSDIHAATKEFLPIGDYYYNTTIGPFTNDSNISWIVNDLWSFAVPERVMELPEFRKSFLYDSVLDWEDNFTHSPLMQYQMPNPSWDNLTTFAFIKYNDSDWNYTFPINNQTPFSNITLLYDMPDYEEELGRYIITLHVNDTKHFILRHVLDVKLSSKVNATNEIDDVTHKRRNDLWGAPRVHTNRIDKLTWIRRNVPI